MRNKIIKRMRMFCLVVMAVCLVGIAREKALSARHERRQDELRKMLADAEDSVSADEGAPDANGGLQAGDGMRSEKEDTQASSGTQSGNDLPQDREGGTRPDSGELSAYGNGIPGEEGGHPILKKYKALYMENEDLAGWLTVEGTKIDYPVMQCEDDEYYLHHDFDGKDSKYGCLYVRGQADLEDGTNFVIYGHNMRDGSMFGELDLYLDEAFYKEHPTILFDTLYEERKYEILAVFRSRIYSEDSDEFKYYQFYEAQTWTGFHDFYDNVKELSLYDTGVEAVFGDTFLTLSTCAYHVNNGRLAVVAKRVEN